MLRQFYGGTLWALALAGCGALPFTDPADQAVLAAVKQAAGDATRMQFTDVRWCPGTVDGTRAAAVYAVGATTYSSQAGAGGYLVEVAPDGTVARTVKADIMNPNIDPEALRIDETYCDGQLVVTYRNKMQEALSNTESAYGALANPAPEPRPLP